MPKVFVSGCFDLLHSGHVAFFKEASSYGDVHVALGSDATIEALKRRSTVNSEAERLYMVQSIRYVTDAFISRGSGLLDFEPELRELKPDLFIVNEDGVSPEKEALCRQLGIELKVLERVPEVHLPARSTTALRNDDRCLLPYRIDLAGTWIDQPMLSRLHPGWAITVSLEPEREYDERSGMATSTRNAAKEIWPFEIPAGHPEKLAKILFHYENAPDRELVSGAQDSIGMCVPGLCRHYYSGPYWPDMIERSRDEGILNWLEQHLFLIPLWPRPAGLDLLAETQVNRPNIRALTNASAACWDALLQQDLDATATAFSASFNAQVALFPRMIDDKIQAVIDRLSPHMRAWKLAGAGGGGYLAYLGDEPVENAFPIRIRRT